jgi:putative ABC transport system substrate-binding protein
MNRRAFVAWLGAVLIAPRGADAQPAAKSSLRIGFLSTTDPQILARSLAAFLQGLRDLGWIEGQNVRIEYRWAEGKVDRIPGFAAELVRLKVDVIVTAGIFALRALQQATKTIPIVSAAILVDPVGQGLVASLARPGGNITGLASQYEEIVTKQVQL